MRGGSEICIKGKNSGNRKIVINRYITYNKVSGMLIICHKFCKIIENVSSADLFYIYRYI